MPDPIEPDNLFVLPGVRPPPESDPVAEDAEAPAGPPGEDLLEAVIEALLLAADGPLTEDELDRVLIGPGLTAVRDALASIQDRLRHGPGGVRLVAVAKGWQLRTDPRAAPWVATLRGGRPVRLSRAALETLTVVAYRQPVTRAEISDLRGVDCSGVLAMLQERELVTVLGRTDDPGRPQIYGTTLHFLELFGLRDLSELPTLRDLRPFVAEGLDGPWEEPTSELPIAANGLTEAPALEDTDDPDSEPSGPRPHLLHSVDPL